MVPHSRRQAACQPAIPLRLLQRCCRLFSRSFVFTSLLMHSQHLIVLVPTANKEPQPSNPVQPTPPCFPYAAYTCVCSYYIIVEFGHVLFALNSRKDKRKFNQDFGKSEVPTTSSENHMLTSSLRCPSLLHRKLIMVPLMCRTEGKHSLNVI